MKIKEEMKVKVKPSFQLSNDGILRFHERLCIPSDAGLKKQIMEGVHYSLYSMHLGRTKMYQIVSTIGGMG